MPDFARSYGFASAVSRIAFSPSMTSCSVPLTGEPTNSPWIGSESSRVSHPIHELPSGWRLTSQRFWWAFLWRVSISISGTLSSAMGISLAGHLDAESCGMKGTLARLGDLQRAAVVDVPGDRDNRAPGRINPHRTRSHGRSGTTVAGTLINNRFCGGPILATLRNGVRALRVCRRQRRNLWRWATDSQGRQTGRGAVLGNFRANRNPFTVLESSQDHKEIFSFGTDVRGQ